MQGETGVRPLFPAACRAGGKLGSDPYFPPHAGQEIILAKAGKPYARLVPLAHDEVAARKPGRLAGRRLPDGFFDPLPPEELAAWE